MANLSWTSVFSSHVDSVAHDPDKNEFYVKWQKGNISIYSNVTTSEAKMISTSASVGGEINKLLRNQRPHRPG